MTLPNQLLKPINYLFIIIIIIIIIIIVIIIIIIIIILSQLSNNYPLLMPVAFKKATGISCSSCPIISDPFIDVSCCLSQCQKVAASRLKSRKGFRTFLFFGPHNQQKIKSKEFLNSSVNTEASAQISPFAYKIRVCLQFISQEGGELPDRLIFTLLCTNKRRSLYSVFPKNVVGDWEVVLILEIDRLRILLIQCNRDTTSFCCIYFGGRAVRDAEKTSPSRRRRVSKATILRAH